MADVSHELGALRFVVDSPLSSKVAMFNNQAQQRQQSQMLNPFSSSNDGRASPKPTFSKDQYGKPLAGSLTEMRGQKANMHVMREMLELCQIIDSEGYKVNDEPNMRVIPFGELFNIYNYISDKVVGILLRARKYKYVQFEGEMLFQRRDDDVPVFLLRPILDIRQEIESKLEVLKRSSSPAPMATTLLLDKGAHEQKLQENALNVPGGSSSRGTSKSRSPSPASLSKNSKKSSPAPEITVTTAVPVATEIPNVVATPVTEISTATDVAEQAPVSTTTENHTETEINVNEVVSTNNLAQSDASDEASTENSSLANDGNVNTADSKTDVNNNNNNNNNGSDINITINELPTILIEASAVYEATEEQAAQPANAQIEAQAEADSEAVVRNAIEATTLEDSIANATIEANQ